MSPEEARIRVVEGQRRQLEARVRELEERESEYNALCGELATILGPGKPPAGVTRSAYWIGRVGAHLGELEDALSIAMWHADNLQRVRNHVVVRDLDESSLAYSRMRTALKEDTNA